MRVLCIFHVYRNRSIARSRVWERQDLQVVFLSNFQTSEILSGVGGYGCYNSGTMMRDLSEQIVTDIVTFKFTVSHHFIMTHNTCDSNCSAFLKGALEMRASHLPDESFWEWDNLGPFSVKPSLWEALHGLQTDKKLKIYQIAYSVVRASLGGCSGEEQQYMSVISCATPYLKNLNNLDYAVKSVHVSALPQTTRLINQWELWGRPSNSKSQNVTCLKNTICVEAISMTFQCLRRGCCFQPNQILRLSFAGPDPQTSLTRQLSAQRES